MERVENLFACICCQDLIFQPITTECSHNFCKVTFVFCECLSLSDHTISCCVMQFIWLYIFLCPLQSCLSRSFSAGVKNCPMCRKELPDKLVVNQNLHEALLHLFPGYEAGRWFYAENVYWRCFFLINGLNKWGFICFYTFTCTISLVRAFQFIKLFWQLSFSVIKKFIDIVSF